MATKKKSGAPRRRSYGRKKTYHKRKEVFHIVPDLLTLGAVAELNNSNGGYSPIELAMAGPGNFKFVPGQVIENAKANWKEEALFIGGAIAVKYVARALHLNNIGTKRLKVF